MPQSRNSNSSSLLTRTDYEHYRRVLDELLRVRDRDLPELLRDARGFVAADAEEEIAQIRDDHVFVEARIAHLESQLRDAGQRGTVSVGSPVGQALLGRSSGDIASVTLPGGHSADIRIVSVRPADDAVAA